MNESNLFNTLSANIKDNLEKINITVPTKVQETIIPLINEKKNIIFQSETGTGKTLAFLLPIIEYIQHLQENNHQAKAIICSPTFELSSQIKQACQSICDIKSALFIGGTPVKRQIETLKEKPEIIIGTPTRIVELIQLKKLKTSGINFIVFDEVDRLVKKELVEETKKLYSLLPENVQTICCTATIDNWTKKTFPQCEVIVMPEENILRESITHWAIYAESRDKIETLRKLIIAENPEKALIFTSRADQVENIYSKLKYKKIECVAVHAKTDKQLRKATIDRFKSGKEKILITSDLSCRGLDIKNISHVIQMDLPSDSDFFVHRAGRTARAGKTGTNILIGDEYEMRNFSLLEKKLKIKVYPKQIRNGKVISPII